MRILIAPSLCILLFTGSANSEVIVRPFNEYGFKGKDCDRPAKPFAPIYDEASKQAAIAELGRYAEDYKDYIRCIEAEMVRDINYVMDGLAEELSKEMEEMKRDVRIQGDDIKLKIEYYYNTKQRR